MKINWFSPLPPARTGVACYATHVLESLAKSHEVTLWTDQAEVDRAVSRFGKVMKFRLATPPWRRMNEADFSIYHIGNHADFHGSILDISRQSPGVVVLHDVRLHDLIYMLFVHARRDRETYLETLERWYGVEGRRAGEAFCAGGLASEVMTERFPLTREALAGALGVVLHTGSLEQMGEAPPCPVTVLAHPYRGMNEEAYRAIAAGHAHRAGPPFRFVLFGFLGRNRRLEPVLRALAETGRTHEFRLEICGELWDEARLRGLIDELGLAECVKLRGFLPEAELHRVLKSADLAFNLRYPSMGEASGSLCRLWDYGIPTLVTETQWYATLTGSAVAFVRPEYEVEDIREHVVSFLDDPAPYRRKGEQGRRELAKYDPDSYAARLVEFAGEALRYSPQWSALRLAERAGDDAGRWLHPSAADPLLDRVQAEIVRAFDGRTDSR